LGRICWALLLSAIAYIRFGERQFYFAAKDQASTLHQFFMIQHAASKISGLIESLFMMYAPRSAPMLSNPLASVQSLYFAYGSNLHFGQMAKRCPESRFLGRARLRKYRWQINERGFANVVPVQDPSSFVDGLCYLLSTDDEIRLDRSEGVPTAYQKELLDVEFFVAGVTLVGRKVSEIIDHHSSMIVPQDFLDESNVVKIREESRHLERWESSHHNRQRHWSQHRRCNSVPGRVDSYTREQSTQLKVVVGKGGEPAKALVYLSQNYVQDDLPWDEYIDRMELGLDEALKQGISKDYIKTAISPFLRRGRGVRKNQRTRTLNRRKIKKDSGMYAADTTSDQTRHQTLRQDDMMEWASERDQQRGLAIQDIESMEEPRAFAE